jgi:hypothetical protein
MLMRIRRKCVSLLTSAALLLALLTPPAVPHAHADGDRPHSHAPAERHQHGHPAHHHHGGALQRNVTAAPIAHTHLSLLFFDFTLPQRDEGESDAPSSLQLLPVAGCSLISQSAPVGDSPSSAAASDAVPRELPPISTPGGGTGPRARNLLCDSARRARTGVLLI